MKVGKSEGLGGSAAIEADAGEVGLCRVVVVFDVAIALELRLEGDGAGRPLNGKKK